MLYTAEEYFKQAVYIKYWLVFSVHVYWFGRVCSLNGNFWVIFDCQLTSNLNSRRDETRRISSSHDLDSNVQRLNDRELKVSPIKQTVQALIFFSYYDRAIKDVGSLQHYFSHRKTLTMVPFTQQLGFWGSGQCGLGPAWFCGVGALYMHIRNNPGNKNGAALHGTSIC